MRPIFVRKGVQPPGEIVVKFARVEEHGLMGIVESDHDPDLFNVTHIPTGLALVKGAPELACRNFVADVLWLGNWCFGMDGLWRGWGREQIVRVFEAGVAAGGSFPTNSDLTYRSAK